MILGLFLYTKNRADGLRDEIIRLRAKLGIKEEAAAPMAWAEEQAARLEMEQTTAMPEAAEIIPSLQAIKEAPVAAMEPEPAVKTESENQSNENLEFKIGSKVFTGVGVVAVICAVGFFLRYAFEVNLINEFGRVVLGVIAGIILLAIGEATRKRYPNYGHSLTGGGLGVLYVSFYAAFNFYNLMTRPATFFAMILVTAAGILLSLRQNSMALAMFAQIGGFLTPFLIDNSSNPHILFLYIALLDLAVFLIAFYKLWQPLSVVSFLGTVFAYLYWYGNYYSTAQFGPAMGYLSLFFVIFLCIPFIQYFIKKSPENTWDLSLVTFNPMFYFMMSYAIINPLYPDLMGYFTLALGAFYCALALIVGGGDERASLFRHFLLTAGFILLAIAVPIQFHGKWIIAGWAAEALGFIATGFRLKLSLYRVFGNLLMLAAIFRLLVFESSLPAHALLLINTRFLSYAICFMVSAAAAYLYHQRKKELGENESQFYYLLLLEAAFLLVAGTSFEIHDFFSNYGKWTVIAWGIEALAFILASLKMKVTLYRVVGHCLYCVALIRLFVFENYVPANGMPLFNLRLLAYGVLFAAAAAAACWYRRNKKELGAEERPLFSLLALEGAFAGLMGLTFEIHDFYGGYWYPILWTAGGLAAGLLSFRVKSVTLRCVTYATFIAAFFRLLIFDTRIDVPGYVPLLNTRVFAFAAAAIFTRLFLAIFRAGKEKMSQDEYQLFQPSLFMMFHFLVLWITSAEIISYCDKQMFHSTSAAVSNFENLKNVLLSAAWTVYGVGLMVAGIIKKTLYERFLAIALFAIVIIKVFLVDTANLNNLYRFYSFIILGCFLLLVGYLYYRYQSRIRKFVKAEK